MVLKKTVLQNLKKTSEKLNSPGTTTTPFWIVLLNYTANAITCKAPNTKICSNGATLSEYELYFNYARIKYPESVTLRPLLWTNGPSPGMLFDPKPTNKIHSDNGKSTWAGCKIYQIVENFEKQTIADRYQGYDFIGYHAYAKRRYNELVGEDSDILCKDVSQPYNTTCSWRGLEELNVLREQNSKNSISNDYLGVARNESDWFRGCGCYMIYHPSGA